MMSKVGLACPGDCSLAQILLKCRQAFGHKTSSAPANSPEFWGLSRLIQREDELKGDPQTFDYLRVAGTEMVADITNSDRETRISVASGSTTPHTMSLYIILVFESRSQYYEPRYY